QGTGITVTAGFDGGDFELLSTRRNHRNNRQHHYDSKTETHHRKLETTWNINVPCLRYFARSLACRKSRKSRHLNASRLQRNKSPNAAVFTESHFRGRVVGMNEAAGRRTLRGGDKSNKARPRRKPPRTRSTSA